MSTETLEQRLAALKISEVAQTEGIQGIPASNAQGPQATELRIAEICGEIIAEKRNEFALRIQKAKDEAYIKANDPVRPESLTQVPNDKRNAAIASLGGDDARLRSAQDELVAKEREWMTFRAQNGLLHRNARYPESKIFHWSWVVLFILVESVINAQFFAQSSEQGLVGGFAVAVMISLFNVLVASLMLGANTLKSALFERHLAKRIGGIVFSIVIVLMLVGFNLLVGHLREVLESGDPDPYRQAARAFLDHPIHLENIHAIQLLLVGLAICFLSTLEGYKSDDEYPGFGDIDREFRKAKKIAELERQDVFTKMQSEISGGHAELKRLNLTEHERIATIQRALSDTERIPQDYEQYVQLIEARYITAITLYRQNNQAVRPIAKPAYWDVPLDLKESRVPFPTIDRADLERRLAEAKGNQDAVTKAFNGASSELAALSEEVGRMLDSRIEGMRQSLVAPGSMPMPRSA